MPFKLLFQVEKWFSCLPLVLLCSLAVKSYSHEALYLHYSNELNFRNALSFTARLYIQFHSFF